MTEAGTAPDAWQGFLLRCAPVILLLVCVVAFGGKADYARPVLGGLVVVGLVLGVWLAPRRGRNRLWLVLVLAPPFLLALGQCLPLGAWHPWLAADARLLEVTGPARWTLDRGASLHSLGWLLVLAAFMAWLLTAWRDGRREAALRLLVVGAALHAVLALLLPVLTPDWPPVPGGDRVRGCFVYPNHFAAFTAACLPLALCCARHARPRAGWLLAAGVMAAALVLSASRAGVLIGLAVNLPFLAGVLPRRWRWPSLTAAGLVLVSLVWLLNAREVEKRFARIDEDARSLNGRTHIWATAIDLGLETPWGTGAGCAAQAFVRGGLTRFEPHPVRHMHSDPVEYLLEFGWAGAALTLLVWLPLAWAWGRRVPWRPSADGKPRQGWLALACAAGLAHLLLHACVDHILALEANQLLACVLAVGALAAPANGTTPATQRRPWYLLALAVLVLSFLPQAWRWEHERIRTRQLNVWLANWVGAQRTPRATQQVRDFLAITTPRRPQTCVLQCELLSRLDNADPIQRARRLRRMANALAVAGELAPGYYKAWGQRVRLARFTDDNEDLLVALRRLRTWAPAWQHGQLLLLQAVADDRVDLGSDAVRSLAEDLLTKPGVRPAWLAAAFVRCLGTGPFAAWLSERREELSPESLGALEPWLARYGDLATWRHAWRSVRTGRPAPPGLLPVAEELGLEAYAIPRDDPTACVNLAAFLDRAGLPMPPVLRAELHLAGDPYTFWAASDPFAPDRDREAQTTRLRAGLHLPWVRRLFDDLQADTAGRVEAFTRKTDPRLLVRHLASDDLDDEHRMRLEGLLAPLAYPRWQRRPACRTTWFRADPASSPTVVVLERWSYMLVDGERQGWRQGAWILPSDGRLHRLTILEP